MSEMEQSDFLKRARLMLPWLVEIRRAIHRNPELSFQETATAGLVSDILCQYGYELRTGVAGTGVIADLGKGPAVAVRADMDALPIKEVEDRRYRSCNDGVMHACGHDVHVAAALGAAILLAKHGPRYGRARFLFQPAEETANRDGKSGAALMIEAGALEDVSAAFALHVDTRIPAGRIAVRTGAQMAGGDRFEITVPGRSSHAAYPQDGIDCILPACQLVQLLQKIVSPEHDPLQRRVLTVSGVRSNSFRANIMADEVVLTGITRYLAVATGKLLRREIRRACRLVSAPGGRCKVKFSRSVPPLTNARSVVDILRQAGRALLAPGAVLESQPEMASDDFTFIAQQVASCYFLLGARPLDGIARPTHSADFDVDENALAFGAALLAECATRAIRRFASGAV